MFAGLPSLSHEQQQKAVERIQELMANGMSSGEAIALVEVDQDISADLLAEISKLPSVKQAKLLLF